jgi:hypothetical protein
VQQVNRFRNEDSTQTQKSGGLMSAAEVVAEVEVVTQVHESIAFVGLRGVVTPNALAQVKASVLVTLAEAGRVLGFMVRFNQADVRCSAGELTAIFDGDGPSDQSTVPAAMLVRVDQMPLFKAHVWECAWRGVVRQAFTDPAQALAWLTERAETAAQTRAGR